MGWEPGEDGLADFREVGAGKGMSILLKLKDKMRGAESGNSGKSLDV
ncbi:hypothetical protein [Desulfosporosinus sp. HMP52]|nr:hypothetical protein [Desulfosporosinus sp. HMP52]